METKILLMIDSPDLAAFYTKELAAYHCHLLSLPAKNVIQKVFDEVPHLIMIDEAFKDGEGRSLALSIKEDLILKYIPIILLVKNKEILLRKKDGAIDSYFEKGQDIQKLIASVKESLDQNYNELDRNPLTHLPGSRSSVLRMERAIHSEEQAAICYVDLSDLAVYNRAYGDAGGDRVIVKLGEIIQGVLKKDGHRDAFLGHLGGDDFIIVAHSDLTVAISEEIIQHFDATIPAFYKNGDRQRGYILEKGSGVFFDRYPIMSVSIVIVHNENMPLKAISELGRIVSELKKNAKKLPGSCYVKYRYRSFPAEGEEEDDSFEVRFPGKMTSVKVSGPEPKHDKYATFFNTIIGEKKIQTLYQPIIEIKTKKIIGYEALTRSLAGSYVEDASGMFSMARESGTIKELDYLCVDQALKNGQELDPDRKLFLNLNQETLMDAGLMKELFSSIGKIGFKNIVIEVTEQSIMRSFDKMREALLELKEQGVSVAIDDVGGGAVSLRDVAILRPDYIKFDRSLVREIDTNVTKQQIILSMILFANGIQAVTTAEGIETKREFETVSMLGITLGQGFYFARPAKHFLKEIV